MDIESSVVRASVNEKIVKISFFLGRNSRFKDKILNISIPEKEAEKLVEDLMRVIWENKIERK